MFMSLQNLNDCQHCVRCVYYDSIPSITF